MSDWNIIDVVFSHNTAVFSINDYISSRRSIFSTTCSIATY